ncbi:MAG: NAD(P)H-dependent glycerol-3-phosphate dehydrogenase [Gemmatimonadota bacterium]|jgi:glycerol-3-phosphate dehydrogenase (NAD(P)+)|nr:NAD(P)-dependent glycerol-3-phosphate dehydrogenase [Gemmatimonadota bacterium]
MSRVAVVGAGAWGTALADVLGRNGHDVTLWAREADVVESVNARHENARFLAGATLDPRVRATGDAAAAVRAADLVILAAPSAFLRRVAQQLAAALPPGVPVGVATKGIEEGSLALMGDVVEAELPGHAVVALSGPSFALEVARRQPTAIVSASADDAAAAAFQRALSSDTFRVYTQHDVRGVELGGSLKNVMAVATGISEGLGLGLNARAALITRGLAEMTRLGLALGAEAATFAGLAGMGDLVLTCTGALSRNRAVGVAIGEGRTLDEALAGKETVAEGVVTTRSARALAARTGVEMPIVEATHAILFEGETPARALARLMGRDLKHEQGR